MKVRIQAFCFLFWLRLIIFKKHFVIFRKVTAETAFFIFYFFSNSDRRRPPNPPPTPPQATEILTIFCLLCISSQGRQRDGTTAVHFGFRHRYLTYRCHPRKTRHSKQTRLHARVRTHARAHDICEQKQAVRTEAWHSDVGCCDTLPHYIFPRLFLNVAADLSARAKTCLKHTIGARIGAQGCAHARAPALLHMKMNPSLTSAFTPVRALWW